MTTVATRSAARTKRHERLRLRLSGTTGRPRLAVFRSLNHIYAQVIDDTSGQTVAAASSLEKGLRGSDGSKTDDAKRVGKLVAERAKAAGVGAGGLRSRGLQVPRAGSLARGGGPRGRPRLLEDTPVARIDPNKLALEERVVQINRVAKVHKGGRRFSFSAVIVVGDGNGHVGVGLGKAGDVPESIRKGVEDAKKNIVRIPMVGTTIPHEVRVEYSAARVMLKPASKGTGVIAGGAVRAVVEAAGIRDILAKVHGSTNPVNVTRATLNALASLHSVEELSRRRGVQLRLVVPGQPDAAIRSREVADAR